MQYKTIEPIKKDGIRLPIGSLIELSTKEADQLLESGCIEPLDMPFVEKINAIGE
jgi:hypothetical protein